MSLVTLASVGLMACSSPPPKMVATTKDEGVPANSASEERLTPGAKPKAPPEPAPAEAVTQPYTTPLNAESTGGNTPAGATGKGATGKGAAKPGAKTGKVTKVECRQTFDRFLDLSMSDPRLEGIPPEMLAQLKAQALQEAQSKQGDPCNTQEVTRAQYNCAMAAPTSTAWQRCMK